MPTGNLIGKHLLEGVGKRASLPAAADPVAAAEDEYDNEADRVGTKLVASPGGADALHRP